MAASAPGNGRRRNHLSARVHHMHYRMARGQIHRPCWRCGRLLAPVAGELPRHRRPSKGGTSNNSTYVPLTGRDAPWCGE